MKNVYLVVIVSCACLMTFVPQSILAQCNCSPGVPATPITQSITIPPTVTSSLTFNFQQFDPSIGTLSCVSLKDTITVVTLSSALNTGPDSTAFLFNLAVPTKITAPGITLNKTFTRIYGYDTLAPHGIPGYSINYGPDTLASSYTGAGSTTGNGLYQGTGTIGIVYAITGGGLTVLDGGLNDTTAVSTTLSGTLNLTYYWCPASLLAYSMTNFTAAKNGNNVELKWQAQNEQKDISYEVQYSTDGSSYASAGTIQSDANAEGTLASYQFQYNINTSSTKLFFRIKRTSTDGKTIAYSAIKTVNVSNGGIVGYHNYPNPVKTYTMIEFDQVLSGNYMVDLVNTAGQVVQHKEVSLTNSNQIRLDLTSHLATGIYYLQVKDQNKIHQYISKIVIE